MAVRYVEAGINASPQNSKRAQLRRFANKGRHAGCAYSPSPNLGTSMRLSMSQNAIRSRRVVWRTRRFANIFKTCFPLAFSSSQDTTHKRSARVERRSQKCGASPIPENGDVESSLLF